MKILLDPLIYWIKNDENLLENLRYWDKVSSIVEKYFDIRYVSSKGIIKAIQRLNKEPSNLGKEYSEKRQQLIKRFFNNLDYPNNIDEVESYDYKLPINFNITNDHAIDECFSNILFYMKSNQEECLIFLSLENQKVKMFDDGLCWVRHISGEINSKITKLIVNRIFLKNGLDIPTLKNPIPFVDLCDHFYDLQNELIGQDDRLNIFEKITAEVALRNLYEFDENVTKKNNNNTHKRKIYTYKKKHYLSADFETGCFELCDYKGIHQGEISYTGNQLSPRDKTHSHDIFV